MLLQVLGPLRVVHRTVGEDDVLVRGAVLGDVGAPDAVLLRQTREELLQALRVDLQSMWVWREPGR